MYPLMYPSVKSRVVEESFNDRLSQKVYYQESAGDFYLLNCNETRLQSTNEELVTCLIFLQGSRFTHAFFLSLSLTKPIYFHFFNLAIYTVD